jgi:hypothetical protein
MEEKNSEPYFEENEPQNFRKSYDQVPIPVGSEYQLGQAILKTHARVSDPPTIETKVIRRKVPVFGIKTVLTASGKEKDVEFIERWEIQEWRIPILKQPKYHEAITDDISTGFLNDGDLEVARTIIAYCAAVKSFADRYNLDLALHHNNLIDEAMYLIVTSGAWRGKRVKLAKTNMAEQSLRQSISQVMERDAKREAQKSKGGLFGGLFP